MAMAMHRAVKIFAQAGSRLGRERAYSILRRRNTGRIVTGGFPTVPRPVSFATTKAAPCLAAALVRRVGVRHSLQNAPRKRGR
jgi:hypothetical protein